MATKVFLVLAVLFGGQAAYNMLFTPPWDPARGGTWLDTLGGLSFLGLPMAFLCFSIYLIGASRKVAIGPLEYTEFGICLLFQVANFAVAMLPIWSQLTRFGAAGLAIAFGILNLVRTFGH